MSFSFSYNKIFDLYKKLLCLKSNKLIFLIK